jgi:hypothetical protein
MTAMSDVAEASPRRFASITRRQASTVTASPRSFAASTAQYNIKRLILVVLWGRRRLIAFPWAGRLWRRHVLRRKENIIAGPAQARTAGPQTRLHPVRVRHIGAAKSKGVRGAGFALLRGTLSEGEGWKHKKERGTCDPAANSIRRHSDFLPLCWIADVR